MKIIDLCGTWKFGEKGASEADRLPVKIPGSVLSGLLDNNKIEDPFKGVNEYATRELLRKDFSFSYTFEMGEIKPFHWDLVLEGVDTIASVLLNGKEILRTDNMHRRYVVPVGKQLAAGKNHICINFTSPITYIESVVPSKGKEIHYTPCGGMTGNQYIRKAHSMFGWDWGPQLPDMGIWRKIYLRGYEEDVLEYLQVKQAHGDGRVLISVSGNIYGKKGKESRVGFGFENKKYKLLVTIINPAGETIFSDEDATDSIEIDNPELWWPNRLGKQPLYTVSAKLVTGEKTVNELTERIGLRSLTISQDEDEYGKEFAFVVNGVKIFAKGADYIPEDCIYSRITRESIKYLIDSSKEVGFNCLRVWGGGYYPSDDFYELCDEAGIIVWQDFMYACNIYDLTKEFEASITKEAIDNIRRLRNHPSLGMWCGNNEIESAWDHWGGFCDHSKALRNDYIKMFEEILPKLVKKEDDEHFYWPSSPSSYGRFKDPDADNVGDRHYWSVWHGEKPFTDYENYFFRFCSEFGFQSWPELATVKTYAGEGDLNVFSEVMESHQKNGSANGKILHYISENFLYPKNFESLLYVSQVLQGMAIKYGVEHWRRKRGRCMGALYWQINDNWPVASWSSIDYYGRWKALHYMARHFFADLQGSVKREGFCFTPYVSNETFENAVTKVKIFVKTMENEVVFSTEQTLNSSGLSVTKGEPVDVESAVRHRENETYLEAVFTNSDGTVLRTVEPMLVYKHMKLPKVNIELTTALTGENTIEAKIKADKFAGFVALICDDARIIWDDNYFFITGGEEIVLHGKLPENTESVPDVRVITLADTYDN